jgi:hypothetical protein
MKKQKNEEIKRKENRKNLFLIVLIIISISVCLISLDTIINRNIEREQLATSNYSQWLSQHCVCLEKNLIYCPEGYSLVGKLCLNKTISTPTLNGCSKYNCAGQIKLFDVTLQKWQNQN